MGEAGHDGIRMAEGLFGQRQLQVPQAVVQCRKGLPDPELEVQRHLVVARARRMQAPGRGADQFGEPRFDIHMDVFERAGKGEGAASISPAIWSRPWWIAVTSSGEMIPVAASMAAWAFEPAMSCAARRWSKPIEALISSRMASGLLENRPPHIALLIDASERF